MLLLFLFFFFKQKTAYEMRISDWSSDVCSSDLRSILKDGDSAKFRGVFFSDGGGVPTSCGEVNAKNAFGGYRGFQRFMSAGSTELTFIEEQVTDFGTVWAKFCR